MLLVAGYQPIAGVHSRYPQSQRSERGMRLDLLVGIPPNELPPNPRGLARFP